MLAKFTDICYNVSNEIEVGDNEMKKHITLLNIVYFVLISILVNSYMLVRL